MLDNTLAKFVPAVMDSVPSVQRAVLSVACHHPTECLVAARVRELNEGNDAKIHDSLQKLHINMGHPGNQHLVRLLKHGGACQRAQELARELQCAQCMANAKPSPALPAQPEMNHRVQSAHRHGCEVSHRLVCQPKDC